MGTNLNEVVSSYAEAWNVGVTERRRLLELAWAADGVYCDPLGRAEGRDALIEYIGEAQGQFPGHRIELTSGIDEHDNQFRFAWVLRGPNAETVIDGVDFGVVSSDGRIQSITGFFGPLPPAVAGRAG